MILHKANLFHILKNLHLNKKEPISVVHFLTNRCNARCSFCFIDFDNQETFSNELSLEEINKLTKNLGNSLLNVNLTGGEPFARKDIVEIAKCYIDNTNIQSLYITTNGSLPDRILNFAKTISKYKSDIELTFQISIDDLPNKHNSVRKIKNLFENCIDSYFNLKKLGDNINSIVSITVNEENCENIENVFDYLFYTCGVESIKCTIVRDEGIYKTVDYKRKKIFDAYVKLTNKIKLYLKEKKLKNYNQNSIQGKLHKKKDYISWEMVKKMYLTPKYISPCHAGSLFGIINAKGLIYPCEILEHKLLGSLRDHDMNFMKIWKNNKTNETKKFIKETKCNCTYECALSYNILGNLRYQPSLLSSLFF